MAKIVLKSIDKYNFKLYVNLDSQMTTSVSYSVQDFYILLMKSIPNYIKFNRSKSGYLKVGMQAPDCKIHKINGVPTNLFSYKRKGRPHNCWRVCHMTTIPRVLRSFAKHSCKFQRPCGLCFGVYQ